jgi:hypothetical protein
MNARWLRQTLSRLHALACLTAIVLLTVMPSVKVAAAGNCHPSLTASAAAGDAHHHHASVETHLPDADGSSPLAIPSSLDCCVPGCCVAPTARADAGLGPRLEFRVHTEVTDRILPGAMPEGLRRPPRTTDIADQTA